MKWAWPTTARLRAGRSRAIQRGELKLVFHRETHTLLGVHIIGEGASELPYFGQVVMSAGREVDYFDGYGLQLSNAGGIML